MNQTNNWPKPIEFHNNKISNNQAAAPQKVTIILNSPNDWDEWLEIIRSKALAGNIWSYMDPSKKETELPILEEPALPLPSNINPQKTLIKDLNDDEKEELQALY